MTTAESLIGVLVGMGEKELAIAIGNLQPESPLHALMLRAAVDALQQHGLIGVEWLKRQLFAAVNGGDPDHRPDIELTDLRLASDLLAALQQLEDDQRSEARNLVTRLSETLGPALAAVLKAILGA